MLKDALFDCHSCEKTNLSLSLMVPALLIVGRSERGGDDHVMFLL